MPNAPNTVPETPCLTRSISAGNNHRDHTSDTSEHGKETLRRGMAGHGFHKMATIQNAIHMTRKRELFEKGLAATYKAIQSAHKGSSKSTKIVTTILGPGGEVNDEARVQFFSAVLRAGVLCSAHGT
eukprot:828045-Rhodomonas_salina.1